MDHSDYKSLREIANFLRKEGGRHEDGKLHPKFFDYCSLMAPPVDPIRQVLVSELKAALKRLKARPLLVASLYLRGFNYEEIAAKIGVTPSRVSQIMTEIVLKLRKKLS